MPAWTIAVLIVFASAILAACMFMAYCTYTIATSRYTHIFFHVTSNMLQDTSRNIRVEAETVELIKASYVSQETQVDTGIRSSQDSWESARLITVNLMTNNNFRIEQIFQSTSEHAIDSRTTFYGTYSEVPTTSQDLRFIFERYDELEIPYFFNDITRIRQLNLDIASRFDGSLLQQYDGPPYTIYIISTDSGQQYLLDDIGQEWSQFAPIYMHEHR